VSGRQYLGVGNASRCVVAGEGELAPRQRVLKSKQQYQRMGKEWRRRGGQRRVAKKQTARSISARQANIGMAA